MKGRNAEVNTPRNCINNCREAECVTRLFISKVKSITEEVVPTGRVDFLIPVLQFLDIIAREHFQIKIHLHSVRYPGGK